MKKDRNTFFEGSSMNMQAFNTGYPQAPVMPAPMPMSAQAQASQSFYANTGTPAAMPIMPATYPQQQPIAYQDSSLSELESRMAKLERNMGRLENRLSKLEGSTYYTTDTYETTSSGGMYMV